MAAGSVLKKQNNLSDARCGVWLYMCFVRRHFLEELSRYEHFSVLCLPRAMYQWFDEPVVMWGMGTPSVLIGCINEVSHRLGPTAKKEDAVLAASLAPRDIGYCLVCDVLVVRADGTIVSPKNWHMGVIARSVDWHRNP
jgi:hypothetical protein